MKTNSWITKKAKEAVSKDKTAKIENACHEMIEKGCHTMEISCHSIIPDAKPNCHSQGGCH